MDDEGGFWRDFRPWGWMFRPKWGRILSKQSGDLAASNMDNHSTGPFLKWHLFEIQWFSSPTCQLQRWISPYLIYRWFWRWVRVEVATRWQVILGICDNGIADLCGSILREEFECSMVVLGYCWVGYVVKIVHSIRIFVVEIAPGPSRACPGGRISGA